MNSVTIFSPPETRSKNAPTIINIQLLRFFAATIVVLVHDQIYIATRNLASSDFRPFYLFNGQIGVDIFFIISGFVMYYVSKDNFSNSGYCQKFLMKRLIRVLPLYWAVTFIMIVADISFSNLIRHSHLDVELILCSLFFLPYARATADSAFPIVGVGWTLNYEMAFYICFFYAVRFTRPKAVTGLTLCFAAAALFHTLFLSGTYVRFLSEWTNPIILEFLFGIALAICYSSGFRWSLWVGLAVFVSGIYLMILAHRDVFDAFFETYRPFIWGVPSLVVCAGLILIRRDNAIRTFMTKLCLIGGDISYALYLTHEFTFNIICIAWRRFTSHGDWLLSSVLFFASIGVAIIVHYGFERPVTGALTRIAKRRQRSPALDPLQKSPELT